MNPRRLSIAFLIALTVSALCTWILGRELRTQASVRPSDLHYVAPSKPLQPGEILRLEDLDMVGWPASNPIAGATQRFDNVVGRAVLYPLEKDQPITDKFLSTEGAGTGLAGKIPVGMRAIALRSDEIMGVAGFLFPGSHLDVLVTYRSEKSPDPTTLTVLQDAEVLAAGQKIQPDPEGKPVTATVVTLLLSPEDAQRAVLASTQGAIHFVLRSATDKAHVNDRPLTLSELSGGSTVEPQAVRAPTPPSVHRATAPQQQIVVETISGDKQSSDSFNGAK